MSIQRLTLLGILLGLLVVGVIGGLCFLLLRPTEKVSPVIVVETTYPGASAPVLADTVAAPLEEEINGVEGQVRLMSECRNDGSYRLTITFKPGFDPNMAQVLVQNRVALALRLLPGEVNRRDITVKKLSPGVLALVSLSSPKGVYDTLYLGNYAKINIKEELSVLAGVGDVVVLGPAEVALRVTLDSDKLLANDLTVDDVTIAIQMQNLQVQAGLAPGGPSPQLELTSLGRLESTEQLEEVILKTKVDGGLVRLKDVGRAWQGARGPEHFAQLDGQNVVLLGVSLLPGTRPHEVSERIRNSVAELSKHCPEGLSLDIAFDFTPNLETPDRPETPEYVRVDVQLPAGASVERIREALDRCATLVRPIEGAQTVLAVSDDPVTLSPQRPCLLVRLSPADKQRAAREQIVTEMRTRLVREVPQALIRLCDLSGPGHFSGSDYPLHFAVCGPEHSQALKSAEELASRLAKSEKLTDVAVDPDALFQPQTRLDVDRQAAAAKGVSVNDIQAAIQIFLGDGGPDFRDRAEELKRLKVRNSKGERVPIADFVKVVEGSGPSVLRRLDMKPMTPLTGNPAQGVTLTEAQALCGREAKTVLPDGYQLIWLNDQ